ncbi:hypothetical protein E8E13_007376 [Curvularia kusanoi]|uniref:DUF7730 domain-containing protein n=1 Tax=Curvularia kusanoi TaxID=90978 RepID=A0A9P4WBG5_CURKU|nr:hypothetical protein E8E13_007376 [Curvularia kusanoi]
MTAIKRQAPNYGNTTSTKKQKQQLLDDVFRAAQDQHDIDFPHAVEKRRLTQDYKNKVYADGLERQNNKQSSLLKLPQEIKDMIYNYVFDDQVLELKMVNGRMRLTHATNADPFGMPMACRTLHQETQDLLWINAIFRVVTFRFVSLLDDWKSTIMCDGGVFTHFLYSVPEPRCIEHFEIVGIMEGSNGTEEMTTSEITGFYEGVDYKVHLEYLIQDAHQNAQVTFTTFANLDQFEKSRK